MSDTQFLDYRGEKIAYCYHASKDQLVTLMFLPGFFSTMKKTKALFVKDLCLNQGWGFLSFDYFGHGDSSGLFEAGTLSRWIEDSKAVIDHVRAKNLILIGSSMGGWIMLHLCLDLPHLIKGLVGIAVAPDFTQYIPAKLTAEQRQELVENGKFTLSSDYQAAGVVISQSFLSDGDTLHVLKDDNINILVPIRLLHGLEDKDAPSHWSELVMQKVLSEDVRVTYVKKGEHSLSTPSELRLLKYTLLNLVEDIFEIPNKFP